jgi:hypothetical protein
MKKATKIVAGQRYFCISGPGRVYNRWFSCLRFLRCCLLFLGGLLLVVSPAQAEVKAGDILVVDPNAGTNRSGALFLVNPTTGQRTVLSDFGNPAQGSLGSGDLSGVAVMRAGKIFVSALFSGSSGAGGALFGVDPDTGNRTVLSDFGQGNIHGVLAYGLAVNAKGKVIANLDRSAPPLFQPDSALVRINPKTDARVLVSELLNPAQGLAFSGFIQDLALEHSGKILIATENVEQLPEKAALFRVNPVTGRRIILSDFTNPGQGADVVDLGAATGCLAVESSRQILVASGGFRHLLLRVDPKTGQRTVLSDFDNPAQGILGASLNGVAVETSGDIVVGVGDAAIGSLASTLLFRVMPKTGLRALLSDSGNPAQGPSFVTIVYIAVVPKDGDSDQHDSGDSDSDQDDPDD